MRAALLLALLAAGFGLAAWWQHDHLDALRRERAAQERVAAGELERTPSGSLEPGRAVLLVGRPSGARPVPRAPAPSDAPAPGPAPDAAAPGERATPETEEGLGDFALQVQAGQTLSQIAELHYGTSDAALVRELAAYNGLQDPDLLPAGAALRLPPIETLQRAR